MKFYTQKCVNYDKIHSKLSIFCVITAKYTVNCQIFALNLKKIYTCQKNLHWRRRPRRRQLSGMNPSSNYLQTCSIYSHSFSECSCIKETILMMLTQPKQKLPNPKLPENPNIFQGSFLTFSNSGKWLWISVTEWILPEWNPEAKLSTFTSIWSPERPFTVTVGVWKDNFDQGYIQSKTERMGRLVQFPQSTCSWK